jgi:hypothetical protein
VKNVGKPCAGEPHARFDGRGLETEAIPATVEAKAACGETPAGAPDLQPNHSPPRQPPTLLVPGRQPPRRTLPAPPRLALRLLSVTQAAQPLQPVDAVIVGGRYDGPSRW